MSHRTVPLQVVPQPVEAELNLWGAFAPTAGLVATASDLLKYGAANVRGARCVDGVDSGCTPLELAMGAAQQPLILGLGIPDNEAGSIADSVGLGWFQVRPRTFGRAHGRVLLTLPWLDCPPRTLRASNCAAAQVLRLGPPFAFHLGDATGHSSLLAINATQGEAVVVLCNVGLAEGVPSTRVAVASAFVAEWAGIGANEPVGLPPQRSWPEALGDRSAVEYDVEQSGRDLDALGIDPRRIPLCEPFAEALALEAMPSGAPAEVAAEPLAAAAGQRRSWGGVEW